MGDARERLSGPRRDSFAYPERTRPRTRFTQSAAMRLLLQYNQGDLKTDAPRYLTDKSEHGPEQSVVQRPGETSCHGVQKKAA